MPGASAGANIGRVGASAGLGGGTGFDWGSLWPDSDAGQAALLQGLFGLGGGIFSGMGQAGESEEQRAFQASENAEERAFRLALQRANQQQQWQQMLARIVAEIYGHEQPTGGQLLSDQLSRDTTGANIVSRLYPDRERARQRAGISAALLGQARNVNVQAPEALRGKVGKVSGGIRIPEGGFSAQTLAPYQPAALAKTDADIQKYLANLTPGVPGPTFGDPSVEEFRQERLAQDRAAQTTRDDRTSDFRKYLEELRKNTDFLPQYTPTQSFAQRQASRGSSRGGRSLGSRAGGAASGAATGAYFGSIVPGIGTGIGAGLGALFGGLF